MKKLHFNKLIPLCFLSLFAVTPLMAASVTVDASTENQTIRGFGGISHPVWISDLTADQRTTAFGNGDGQLGFSILRIWISSTQSDWSKDVTTAQRAIELEPSCSPPRGIPGQHAESFGTTTLNGNTLTKYRLKSSSYGSYVDYLNTYNTYMKNNGVDLYALSIQNEPDYGYDWTWWTADEIYSFVKNYAGGITANRVITPESFSYNKTYYNQLINDANAWANVDILGTHFYSFTSSTADASFQYSLYQANKTGKELWMTEHYTDSSNDADLWPTALDVAYEIHRALAVGQFNAYVWWYIRRSYGPMKEDGTISKRGYCMAQFSKYIRPGYVRVDATINPTTGLYVSAYKGQDSLIVVVVNRNTSSTSSTFSLSGFDADSYTKLTTSASKSLNNDGTGTVTSSSFTESFEASSVSTLIFTSTTPISSSSATSSSSVAQEPYSSATIPGTIEAENYDLGGANVAYYDEDSENQGGEYRDDGVDITLDSTTNDYVVGYTKTYEWLEYTVNVTAAGAYKWEARVASGSDGSAFHVLLDGTNITDTVNVTNTGSWNTYTTMSGMTPTLTAGEHVMRLVIDGDYVNIDWISFTDTSTTLLKTGITEDLSLGGNYEVYNVLGVHLGTIALRSGESIRERVRGIVSQSGVYLAKNRKGGHTYLIDLRHQ